MPTPAPTPTRTLPTAVSGLKDSLFDDFLRCAVNGRWIELTLPSNIVSFFDEDRGFEASVASTERAFSAKGSFDEQGRTRVPIPQSLPEQTYEVSLVAPLAAGGELRGSCQVAVPPGGGPTAVASTAPDQTDLDDGDLLDETDEPGDGEAAASGQMSIDTPTAPPNDQGLLAALGLGTFGAMAVIIAFRRLLGH